MYSVRHVDSKFWLDKYSEKAHLSSFGEFRPKELERIDFALVATDGPEPKGFVTCKEMDSETLYWQYGGAFSGTQNTFAVAPCYFEMIKWCLDRYQRVTTRIENTNIAMLKLAFKVGFLVIGTRVFNNQIFLELLLEKGE